MSPSNPNALALVALSLVCSFAACSDATVPEEEFTGWAEVAVGSRHACALTDSGVAYCWGDSSEGQAGLTGGAGLLTEPTRIDTDLRFTDIDAGGVTTCGRTAEGRLFCWGDNQLGQLGNGGIADAPRPWEVEGQYTWTDVSVGNMHVCATESGGTMLCWGGDRWDMVLGHRASQTCPYIPDREARIPCVGVPTPVDASETFTSVEASMALTCGGTAAGAVCWGSNEFGELGRTSTETCATTEPTRFGTRQCARGPGPPAGHTFSSILPGTTHSCALDSAGSAYCWGALALDMGQLGNGTTEGSAEPGPVTGIGSLSYLATSTNGHVRTFTCGIETDGAGFCWGANTMGQLGTTSTDNCGSFAPIPCSTIPLAIDTSAGLRSMALGTEFACAVTLDGEILCWGRNDMGQLGDGSRTTRQTPAAVFSP